MYVTRGGSITTLVLQWTQKKFLSIITIILLNSSVGFCQFGGNISQWTVFDDNAFKNYENISDIILQPSLTLFYDIEKETKRLQFFYDGSFAHFDEYTTRQFWSHSIGVTGNYMLAESKSFMTWGVQADKRLNQAEYDYYNYQNYSGYLDFRFENTGNAMWNFNVYARARTYQTLPEFNFLEISSYVRRSFFLPTKTTVIGQVQLGYKKFTEPSVDELIIENIMTERGKGWGKGKGQQNNPAVSDSIAATYLTVEAQDLAQMQWLGLLRIAQSVLPKTGLAVQGLLRRNISGEGRIITGQDGGYEDEDYLFDDPYSYDSDELSLELTQIVPWNIQAKIGFDYAEKRYNRNAYDLNGEIIDGTKRTDTVNLYWLSVQKTFPIKNIVQSLQFVFSYTKIDNNSNDLFFDHSNQITTFGWNLMF